MRRRRAAVGAVAVAGGVATAALLVADGLPRTPVVGDPGPWTILAGPDFSGDVAACWSDPAVESAITPAVWPGVATTVHLVQGATRVDAQRVVACLVTRAGAAPVEVHRLPG
jgi:hypothetical protein